MASIATDANGNRLVKFRYGKREFTKSAGTRDLKAAEAAKALVEDTIMRLRRGWLSLPEGADAGIFIMSGGKWSEKPNVEDVPKALTLGDLFSLYEASFPLSAKEDSTWQTEGYHKRHLLRILGTNTHLDSITLPQIQAYANKRSEECYRGKAISPQTITKELETFRMIWNWGRDHAGVELTVPYKEKAVHFAKTADRPPFKTYEEIARTIKRGGVSEPEKAVMWECLYLNLEEVHEVLEHVRLHALHPFVYPMFVIAALTGARRSEICRSRIEDWDLEGGTVNLRERKRKKARITYRTVDITPALLDVMKSWLTDHPGGQHSICKDGERITVKMATDHFKRTLARSKWSVIPGFHTFRHSFASILASKGVDEATIDRWMGHQTLEQRERYRHLFPKNRKRAIDLLSIGVGT